MRRRCVFQDDHAQAVSLRAKDHRHPPATYARMVVGRGAPLYRQQGDLHTVSYPRLAGAKGDDLLLAWTTGANRDVRFAGRISSISTLVGTEQKPAASAAVMISGVPVWLRGTDIAEAKLR